MIRQVIRGATFQRDAYLRAVIGSNGTGDAVIIVATVYVVLALTISLRAIVDVVGHARFVLNGGFAWLILTGFIYLIARYAINGQGSFQGMLAMSALAHPVLLLLVLAQVGGKIPLAFFAQPTLVALEVHRLDFLGAAVVILATLWFLAILAAGTRVAMSLTIDRAILAVAGGYLGWWVIGSMLGL
ncbi:MAG: YIP1 family protein [Acidimicrobiia bacterium]|nr:YIP1 family protein [Acidimicrobiia bacterium]